MVEAKVLWRRNTTSFAYGSPTISADGHVVFFPPSGDTVTYALSADDGSIVWRRTLATAQGSTQPALSADGKTLFVVGQDHSNCGQIVFALDTADGVPIWPDTRPFRGSLGSCGKPAALTIDGGGTLWVLTGGNVLMAISPTSGNATFTCNATGKNGASSGVVLARDGLAIAFPNAGGVLAVGA